MRYEDDAADLPGHQTSLNKRELFNPIAGKHSMSPARETVLVIFVRHRSAPKQFWMSPSVAGEVQRRPGRVGPCDRTKLPLNQCSPPGMIVGRTLSELL